MEDYKEKYEQALERARTLHKLACETSHKNTRMAIEEVFPELKESEDERVRKELINFFKNHMDSVYEEISDNNVVIAWLEKQGEQKPTDKVEPKFKVGDKIRRKTTSFYDKDMQVARIDKDYYVCNHIGKFSSEVVSFLEQSNYELIEQKPTDKVEPKFKVGDWIINSEGMLRQILSVDKTGYQTDYGWLTHDIYDNTYHLWTIQDAKDGDVLYECNEKKPFIFKELKTKHIGDIASYCDIFNGIFNPNEDDWTTLDIVPVTKEQRDILFQKMKEAGYEWDGEKKELRKIEQKPTDKVVPKFKVGDVIRLKGGAAEYTIRSVTSTTYYTDGWSYDIEGCEEDYELVEQKSTWSEEDESILQNILVCLKNGWRKLPTDILKYENWLKSIKERYSWKPSDEQIEALLKLEEMHVLEHEKNQENAHLYMVIKSIREQLLKLKGE